jgi:nucleoside-diphosphate-sugar epimerase
LHQDHHRPDGSRPGGARALRGLKPGGELAAEIRKHIPEFVVTYEPDPVVQAIADSWPRTIDDSAARQEWGWQPSYDLASMTTDMLDVLDRRYREGRL